MVADLVDAAGRRGEAVPSPCIDVCRMDEQSGRCAGCLRSIDEIIAWPTLDDAAKRGVWAELAARRADPRFEGRDVSRPAG